MLPVAPAEWQSELLNTTRPNDEREYSASQPGCIYRQRSALLPSRVLPQPVLTNGLRPTPAFSDQLSVI
jgi:hypothetical protein